MINEYGRKMLEKRINDNILYYETCIYILNNISFNYKKDGSIFKDIKKTINLDNINKHLKKESFYNSCYIDFESYNDYLYIKCKYKGLNMSIYIEYKENTINHIKESIEKALNNNIKWFDKAKKQKKNLTKLYKYCNDFTQKINNNFNNLYYESDIKNLLLF